MVQISSQIANTSRTHPTPPAPPPTDDEGTKSEATETPCPVQGDRRLSHGAPHCVQNEAFVEDACDLCYGGCHACWVYLSDTNEVACVDETTHYSWDGMETCLNEDSVPNRATTWCGATPAPTYLYCEDGYVEDCEGDGSHCCPESWIGNGDCDVHYECDTALSRAIVTGRIGGTATGPALELCDEALRASQDPFACVAEPNCIQ